MSGPNAHASSLPALRTGGVRPEEKRAKANKYSLDASSRNPEAARRARQYAESLANSSMPASGKGNAAVGAAPSSKSAAMLDTQTGLNQNLHLSPAESYVAAQKAASAERWRSSLLHYEADLRELVASHSSSVGEEPPSTNRVIRTIRIFDGVCSACESQSPFLAEMLRLFRIEFCRSIFSDVLPGSNHSDTDSEEDLAASSMNGTGGGVGVRAMRRLVREPTVMERMTEERITTFFDQVGYLLRENALLTEELGDGNTQTRVAELTKENAELLEKTRMYENEIGRLSRQCEQALDQCNRTMDELAETKQRHEAQIASGEKDLQALNVENKDLQLQLFRLRKQVAGGRTRHLKDAYRQMKAEKMQMLTTLFSEGDERMAILVMLSQLESRVNEVLDRYDNDYMLTSPATHTSLRKTMCGTVVCVLEEMHQCEQNYRRLVPQKERDPNMEEPDETDGYVAILFDQKIYENLMAREAIKQRLQKGAQMLMMETGADERPLGDMTDTSPVDGKWTSPGFQQGATRDENGSPLPAQSTLVDVLVPTPENEELKRSAEFVPSSQVVRVPSAPASTETQQGGDTSSKKQGFNDNFLRSSFIRSTGSASNDSGTAAIGNVQAASFTPSMSPGAPLDVAMADGPTPLDGVLVPNNDDDMFRDRLEDLVFLKRSEWIERIFTPSPQEQLIRGLRVLVAHQCGRSECGGSEDIRAETLMGRLIRHPLHDLSSRKFLSSIDVFYGIDPVQQQRLCTINYVDPAIPIQLPERANYMKIKYRSSYAPKVSTGGFSPHGVANSSATDALSLLPKSQPQAMRYGRGSESTKGASNTDYEGLFMTATGDLRRMGREDSETSTDGVNTPQNRYRKGGGKEEGVHESRAGDTATSDRRGSVAAKRLKAWGAKTNYTEETERGTRASLTSASRMGGMNRVALSTGRPGTALRGDGGLAAQMLRINGDGTGGSEVDHEDIFKVNENLRVFRELTNPTLMKSGRSEQQKAGATSSTTAATVAFQRLNPQSPNRGPEWTLYRSLFSGFRSLTPRMIEVTTIDHILLCACERHYTRMEYRYEECLREAMIRATNSQMSMAMAERFFRESYELTDFQESIVDELECRYSFPELVSKTMYEILCYLDAMAPKDDLLALYLNVIRGFQPPTHLHYTCFTLFHLSYCWPTSNPTEEVARDDVLTVLRYLFRNTDNVVHVDIHEVLRDYQMTTRSAPITFVSMRQFLAAAMMHHEDSMLLYFNGLFSSQCECDNLDQLSYENYEGVIVRRWQERAEQKSIVRFLSTGLGLDRGPLLTVRDLAAIAASEWCSNLLS